MSHFPRENDSSRGRLIFHGEQELDVAVGFLQTAGQQVHSIKRREVCKRLAHDIDLLEFIGMVKEFLFTRTALDDIDRRVNPAVGKSAVEDEFHVTGSLKLLKDDLIHTRSGVDQCGGDDRQRSALFDVAGSSKEAFGFMQRTGIDTPGKNFS